MPERRGKDMTLRITACRSVYTGRNSAGTEYTIYEVEAQKSDGTAVNEKLRAFSSLPIGQTVEVTVVPFNSDRHGRSFTLYPRGGAAASPSQGRGTQLNDLAERVAALEEKISLLFQEWRDVKQLLNASGTVGLVPGPPPPTQATNGAELDQKFGEGAPW